MKEMRDCCTCDEAKSRHCIDIVTKNTTKGNEQGSNACVSGMKINTLSNAQRHWKNHPAMRPVEHQTNNGEEGVV